MIMTVLAPLPAAESWKTRTSPAIGIQRRSLLLGQEGGQSRSEHRSCFLVLVSVCTHFSGFPVPFLPTDVNLPSDSPSQLYHLLLNVPFS